MTMLHKNRTRRRTSGMWGEATTLALADDIGKAVDEHATDVFDRAQGAADEYD